MTDYNSFFLGDKFMTKYSKDSYDLMSANNNNKKILHLLT